MTSRIEDLQLDPNNARKHSRKNKAAIQSSVEQFGAARSIVIDNDGVVRAGNGTLEAAKKAGISKIKIIDGNRDELVVVRRPDWTDTEAKAYAIADNKSSDLSEWDDDVLAETLKEISESSNIKFETTGFSLPEMESLLNNTIEALKEKEEISQEEDVEYSAYTLSKDVKFASSNEFGIPDLLPGRLCSDVPSDIFTGDKRNHFQDVLVLYNSSKPKTRPKGSIYGFYVDDARFEVVWKDIERVTNQFLEDDVKALIEPDFSMWRDEPLILQMYARYKSQWVARYWQESGIDVIPSLNWSTEKTYDFCFEGIPEECDLVSCQARTTTDKLGKHYFIKGLQEGLDRINPKGVMIYGGKVHRNWIEPELKTDSKIYWLDSFMKLREERKKEDGKET